MPLTAADVHNVAFSKPPIGKRGYNEDEVDAFLDLVEQEISRLIDENADLRQRVGELESSPGRPAAARPAAAAAAAPAAPSAVAIDAGNSAAKVLTMAQETADRVTAQAKADAENMTSTARANADKLLSDAQRASDALNADARRKADALLSDARTKSEAHLQQAKDRSEQLTADAERKHAEAMTLINKERTVHESRIEQLKTYEREYRTRLKSFLEAQLAELDNRGAAVANDSKVGR